MDKNDDILMDGIDERIESFLRGTMSVEEETAFKQELKANPELRNRAMAMASLIRGLQTKNEATEQAIIQETTSKVRPLLWWACSVAAVFAIFFGIYKDRRYSLLDATVSPYYAQYDVSDISRGETDSVAICHLYSLFNQIQEKRNVSDIIKELEPVYASLETDYTYYPYANDIAWNLALAYIKDDSTEKAIPILQKLIADNPETPIASKAQELLETIKEL